MIKAFLKFLGGQDGEEKPMLLLLGKGFFMGIFLACYQVSSETLFLDQLSSLVDVAFFIQGGLGIISTVVFVFLQRRIRFSVLVSLNVGFITLFTTGAWFFRSAPIFEQLIPEVNILVFALFVMSGPITAISLLGFWGLFGRVFDLRQSRRIIGGIDTGQLTATIMAGLIIWLLGDLIKETTDLLLVASMASFGILYFTIWIARTFGVDDATKNPNAKKDIKQAKYLDLIRSPYLRLLSLFLIFSMGASVFSEFTYLQATSKFYPNEEDMRGFIAFFNATIMGMSFLIQSFINDYIINTYGLRIALMTMPIVLILFTSGAIFTGHLYGFEDATQEEFIFFFLFSALGRLFTAALKDALENPAFKLFFLPLDVRIRFDIQTKIEGVVNEFATLAAGAFQMFMGLFIFFELIHYSYIIVALAVLVIFLADSLFNQYKRTLRTTLETQKAELKGEADKNLHTSIHVIENNLKEDNPGTVIHALKLLERLDPFYLEYQLLENLDSPYPEVREHVYRKLSELILFGGIEIVKRKAEMEKDPRIKKIANRAITKLQRVYDFELVDKNLRRLVRSTKEIDRIYGARLLQKNPEDKFVPYVYELLRDINPKVRQAAIFTSGKLGMPEFWNLIIENLHVPEYSNYAYSALCNIGDNVLFTIDTEFYKTNQFFDTKIRIIQILGRIGGRGALELLWKKIDYPEKRIVSEIYLSLSYIGFQSSDLQSSRIKLAIESDVGKIAWNTKALMEIPNDDHFDKMIRDALFEENRYNVQNIFRLLAMVYDPESILLVKENIEDGTTDSITFAVEMLDVFVDEELKAKLFPALDDLTAEEKIKKLNNYYPPEDFDSYEDLLLQIVNRDYNTINKWTKSLALYKLQMMGVSITDDIIANLFNPNSVIRQTAAAIMYRLDPDAYHLNTQRLKPEIKKDLDAQILPPLYMEDNDDYHQKLLAIERAILLKEIKAFNHIPGEILLKLVEFITEVKYPEGTMFVAEGDSGRVPIYVVLRGSVRAWNEDWEVQLHERDVIGETHIVDSDKFSFSAEHRIRSRSGDARGSRSTGRAGYTPRFDFESSRLYRWLCCFGWRSEEYLLLAADRRGRTTTLFRKTRGSDHQSRAHSRVDHCHFDARRYRDRLHL